MKVHMQKDFAYFFIDLYNSRQLFGENQKITRTILNQLAKHLSDYHPRGNPMLDSVTLKLKTGIKQCPSHSFRGAINLNKTNNPKPLSPKITELYSINSFAC